MFFSNEDRISIVSSGPTEVSRLTIFPHECIWTDNASGRETSVEETVDGNVTMEIEVCMRSFSCRVRDYYFGEHLNEFNDALLRLLKGDLETAVLSGTENADLRFERFDDVYSISGLCAHPYLQWDIESRPRLLADGITKSAFHARWLFTVSKDKIVSFQRRFGNFLSIVNRTADPPDSSS